MGPPSRKDGPIIMYILVVTSSLLLLYSYILRPVMCSQGFVFVIEAPWGQGAFSLSLAFMMKSLVLGPKFLVLVSVLLLTLRYSPQPEYQGLHLAQNTNSDDTLASFLRQFPAPVSDARNQRQKPVPETVWCVINLRTLNAKLKRCWHLIIVFVSGN